MTFDEYRNHLGETYAKGNLGLCLEALQKAIIKDWNRKAYESFLKFSNRYETLRTEQLQQGLGFQDYARHNAELGAAFLDLVRTLEEKDLDLTFMQSHKIYPAVWLVAAGTEALLAARRYFPDNTYNLVMPLTIDQFDFQTRSTPNQLVVFCNLKGFKSADYESKIKKYLDASETPAFYFGIRLDFLDAYPDKIYAANTVFSLNARIREMLEYLKSTN